MQLPIAKTIRILQIGAGGTGGYLVPKIARLIMTMAEFRPETPVWYTLMDDDVVEYGNLYRQNFCEADIGLPKAETLAERYSRHCRINIGFINEKLCDTNQLACSLVSPNERALHIIIGCVDNNRARKVMHDFFVEFQDFDPLIYIDAGNGRYNGQVVVGIKNEDKTLSQPVGVVFPDALIENEDDEEDVGCTMNALISPQNIIANDLAATMVFTVLNMILVENEINSSIFTFDGRRQVFNSIQIEHDGSSAFDDTTASSGH